MDAPPPEGSRVPFDQLPAALRRQVGHWCGDIVEVDDRAAGFSPGVAAVVRGRDGTCFVKAVSSEANPIAPLMHRREAGVLERLRPTAVPAPALLAFVDEPPWVGLITEAIPGANPALPWRREDVTSLVDTIECLHRDGDPSPIEEPAAAQFDAELRGWRTLAAASDPGPLPDWTAASLDALAELEAAWPGASEGDVLLHGDVRGDNLLVHQGHGVLIDWPAASRGHPLLDVVFAAPAVAMQGGPNPADLLAMTSAGRAADSERLRPLVAAFTGYLVERAGRPDPPGLPTVRAFQRAQAAIALPWLRSLL